MAYKISQEYVADKPGRKRKMGKNDFPKPGAVGISKKGQVAEANISKELSET